LVARSHAIGEARFEFDIPCPGDYHVWVRATDAGNADSYFVQVDGMPLNPAIFEVDCSAVDMGTVYLWRELNRREQQCVYIEDPWVQTFDEGMHQVVFEEREPGAIARLIITGDANFVPGPSD